MRTELETKLLNQMVETEHAKEQGELRGSIENAQFIENPYTGPELKIYIGGKWHHFVPVD